MTMTDAAVPRGLKGVIVADTALGDVRGLEGFYHYRQYSAPELAASRGRSRTSGTCCSTASCPSLAARPRSSAEIADAAAPSRRPARRCSPPSPAGDTHRWARCAPRCRCSPRSRTMPPTYDADPATIRANALRLCAVTPVLVAALHRASIGPRADRAASPTSPTAANYLFMIDGDVPDPAARPGARAVPDPGHRPRLQRVDVHRPRRHLDRCRRGRGGRRRARRALGPAARRRARAARSTRSTPSAPPTRTEAWVRARGRRRRADHGLRSRRLPHRRPALGHAARGRRGRSAARGSTSRCRSRRPSSGCSPSSSPAASCTPTSSTTPAW